MRKHPSLYSEKALIVDIFIHVEAKNKEELTRKITIAQVNNSAKYSTDFDYKTKFFSQKKAVVSYKINIKQARFDIPIVEDGGR